MYTKIVIFSLLVITSFAIQPRCVWYRKAPACGNGDDCPKDYPVFAEQASKEGNGIILNLAGGVSLILNKKHAF